MDNSFTILLQGRIEPKAMDFWANNLPNSKIVVSVWDDDIQYDFPEDWNVVVNKKPVERIGFGNFDLQLLSTLEGLKTIHTQWVIKMRCDEYYSNLSFIVDKMVSEPDKIMCGSLFFKEVGMHPFAISDHIIGGKTDNIKLMFQSAYENIKNGFWKLPIPESQLGFGYLWERDSEIREKVSDISIYDSLHPDPTPFNSDKGKIDVGMAIKSIETFTNRIRGELGLETPQWKNIKVWNTLMEYSVKDIERYLQKSEYPNINEREMLKRWFHIIDVNELKPYLATAITNSGDRMWLESNFDNYLCITEL